MSTGEIVAVLLAGGTNFAGLVALCVWLVKAQRRAEEVGNERLYKHFESQAAQAREERLAFLSTAERFAQAIDRLTDRIEGCPHRST